MDGGWSGSEQQMGLLKPFFTLYLCPAFSLEVPAVPAGDKRGAAAQPGIPLTFLSISRDVGVSSGYKIRGSVELSLGEEQGLGLVLRAARSRAAGAASPRVTGASASPAQMAAVPMGDGARRGFKIITCIPAFVVARAQNLLISGQVFHLKFSSFKRHKSFSSVYQKGFAPGVCLCGNLQQLPTVSGMLLLLC